MARYMVQITGFVGGALALLCGTTAFARDVQPSLADSFPIGNSGAVCEAQGVAMGAARGSIFDRKWALLCADIAKPVGAAYQLRGGAAGLARLVAARGEALDCGQPQGVALENATGAQVVSCRSTSTGLEWRSYSVTTSKVTYVVEGLAGYDSALQLALRSLMANKALPGEVSIASTGGGSAAGLAQAQASVADAETVLGQGYRRNNAGAYAEAAEFFQLANSLPTTGAGNDPAEQARHRHEMTINRALQMSNLGEFATAKRLFVEAKSMIGNDPVESRLLRNFEAIDALNQGDFVAVLAILDRPVPPLASANIDINGALRIDRVTAAGLNVGKPGGLAGIMGQEVRLTVAERVAIIDAQAAQLRGSVLRLSGHPDQARQVLSGAGDSIVRIRDGRVVSIIRLRSQILSETALALEAEGKMADAEAALKQALDLVVLQYPDSASVNGAKARLASFLVRRGREDEALGIYRAITANVIGNRGALVGMSNQLQPYFSLLAARAQKNPAFANDLFLASQLIERPGASDTLALLARELEGGSSEAAAMFRQSIAISREIERGRIALANAANLPDGAAQVAELSAKQERLLQSQAQAMNALAAYPQFRSVSHAYVTADEMRAMLKPGEAYLKVVQIGGELYASYVSAGRSSGWKLPMGSRDLDDSVSALRSSISSTVNGVRETYPFDVDAALKLSNQLLAPVAADIASVRHLIFEPDGALLQLPVNLLVTDKAGVDAYHARVDSGGDEFDFRGLAWLGRDRAISTALSAASFRDARKAPASRAGRSYLGLGQNQPLGAVMELPSVRGVSQTAGCEWPVTAWNRPIAADELRDAASVIGMGRSDLLTGAAFSDSAIKARGDLADFRIVHFATHGLVTAPRDDCPARPALLTSFGDASSDGLLQFDEIFNLHLDADLVVLSACDTAGAASVAATQEAGITGGGGQALDGLVRAFIGAGGRVVIASHWPAPDEFGATRRLFSGLFGDNSSDTVGVALEKAQRALMDDPETSHPFYWSGFAIIGDGARPLFSQ